MTAVAASHSAPPQASTKRALTFVYVGYAFRYLYLLVLVPFYARVLGAAEYGRVLAGMSVFQFVWMLSEYGFPSVGVRDIAVRRTPRRIADVYGRQLSGRLWMTGLGLVVGAVGTIASPLLRERPIFGILATLSGVTAAFNLGWFFQGTLHFRTSVALEILGFAINLLVVLRFVHRQSDSWIVVASLCTSSVVATALAHAIALRSMDRSSLRVGGGLALVRESTALFAARGLALMNSSSATFLISTFATAEHVGWYGAAERLATVGLSLMQPANQVMIGTVSGLIASKSTQEAAFALVRRALTVLTGLGVVMLVGALAVAGIAVPLVLGPEFGPTVRMLRILSVMFPLAAFAQVIEGYLLVPLRYDRVVPLTSLAGAVVTVAGVLVLGRLFGGDGVACARVMGYAAMTVVLRHVLRREGLFERVFPRRAS